MSEARCRTACGQFRRLEFVTAMAILGFALLLGLGVLPQTRAARQLRACQENLKTIGMALRMYASESKGEAYPKPKLRDCAGNVQPWSGALDLEGFYPEYLKDLDLLVCPAYPAGETAREVWDEGKTTNPRWTAVEGFSNNGEVEPCEVLARPYYYYGWALANGTFESRTRYERADPEDISMKHAKDRGLPVTVGFHPEIHFGRFRMAVATRAHQMLSGELDSEVEDWLLRHPSGKPLELPMGSKIPFLREGAERWYITDIGNPAAAPYTQGLIVVLHEELFEDDEAFYHAGGAMNLLYMDGHVDSKMRRSGSWYQEFPFDEAGLILRNAVDGKWDQK